ncbi:MAG: endonuclease-3 [Candidatus Marinamargulisbacteria bacterium]|jgi:endonuclease-3
MTTAIKDRAEAVFEILERKYPNVGTFLTHESPFQLLIAVLLSAQCTDVMVNRVTPGLFSQFPDVMAMADAEVSQIREAIKSINYNNTKALHVSWTSKMLRDDFAGSVPENLVDLTKLPGVGRKTANVVLGQAFDIPGITVDTHVNRLTRRLGFTKNQSAEPIERDLMKVWKKEMWTPFSSTLILHGRETCKARKPACDHCELFALCPRAGV